ncbi:MAG TPA: hypothetical protein DDW79_06790 [Anaerolineae bacterium]|nr:hypothetical protein [Anaerolineae bacterium]HCM97550.1 hypothetical protein [Anaerolineae bacterium]
MRSGLLLRVAAAGRTYPGRAGFRVDLLAVLRHVEIRLRGAGACLWFGNGWRCYPAQAWIETGTMGYDITWLRHTAHRPAAHRGRTEYGRIKT